MTDWQGLPHFWQGRLAVIDDIYQNWGIQKRKRRHKGMKQGKWWVQSHVKFVIQLENSGADILISQFDDIMTGNLG